jgi:predicted Zn-dependent protease
VILNNLGWLYARKGDPRGVGLVRTAYELAPNSPEIQDTYGWILVKGGKVKEGLEVLEKAAEALPKSAEIQYHYAAALAQSNKKAEALEILTRVLAEKSQFDERKEADALLETLKGG